MAGKYGPADVTVTLEDGPGGTPRNIESFLLNGFSAKDIARMIKTDGLGTAWEEVTPTGKKAGDPFPISGAVWDTTASTGSHAVFGTVDDGPEDDGRELVAVFGDSKTWTRDYRLSEYEVVSTNDSIQTFNALLTPTGAAVWT